MFIKNVIACVNFRFRVLQRFQTELKVNSVDKVQAVNKLSDTLDRYHAKGTT